MSNDWITKEPRGRYYTDPDTLIRWYEDYATGQHHPVQDHDGSLAGDSSWDAEA